jgi:hypothetical protein
MTDPWAKFRIQEEALPAAGPVAPEDPWAKFRQAEPEVQGPPIPEGYREPNKYTGSVLPFSIGQDGKAQFDSAAGILGSVKRAFTLPGDVYAGREQMPMPTEMNREQGGRVAELAGVASPVSPALRAPGAAGTVMRPEKVKPPTAEHLKQDANLGYDRVRDMSVDYSSRAVAEAAMGITAALEKDGILTNLAPKTHGIVQQLRSPPDGSVAPLAGLEAARRALGHAARDFGNPTEQLAARRAIDALDDFITRSGTPDGAGAVVAGAASTASKTLADARGNYAAAKRSDQLTGATERAELNAAVANSGLNLDNAVRQRVRSVLQSPKESAGFSEAELAALNEVARGTPTRNAIRIAGNLLGGGGGLGAVVSGGIGGAVGTATGGPFLGAAVGAGIPATGMSAKKLAGALTERSLRHADDLVRMRSPLYEQMMKDAKMVPMSPERRAMLVRALLMAGQGEASQGASTFHGAP